LFLDLPSSTSGADRPLQRFPLPLVVRGAAALEALAARPVVLVCAMLLANALLHPYRGLFHDARLYAVQAVERAEPGSLAQDLYLQFGSQDRYSIFSLLMAPLIRVVGLESAFFLGYLVSRSSPRRSAPSGRWNCWPSP
jgi:hypothetical protein